ncbi:O-antigen ligase family protein [Enterococcus faecium]|uniref:O-antigen ligase family protein n=1 Tax=Enterococcus faecium TaxID=1352 RepID=UPI000F50450A|nr:hypothetical protein [Enterococcus faecium]EGP5093648.1 hypothetical protein [Enterococcus faecium]EMF0291833.1 hypothetical protein [Enterococcus faecium]MBD9765891.1 hypothetical protein [Enterococcus faecium]MCV3202901.1 hypothetical protein [Enterococcus faecium]MCV6663210.1 hypothetical protein [Enterococcus faecium]
MQNSNVTSNIAEEKNSSSFIIYVFMTLLIFIQQLPIFQGNLYSQIRLLIYLLMISLILTSFFKSKKRIKNNILFYGILLLFFSVLLSVISIVSGNPEFSTVMELGAALGVLYCSASTHVSERNLSKLVLIYIFLSSLLSIILIYTYNLSFQISEQYLVVGKNQIGPLLSYGLLISLYIILYTKKNMSLKVLLSILTMISFFTLIMMRNRSSLIAIFIVVIILIVKKITQKITLKKLLILILSSFVLFLFIQTEFFYITLKMISDSLFLNYNVNDLNSLSANRTDVYLYALHYIKENFLFGELISSNAFTSLYGFPHNYVLNKLVLYGFFGGMPFILFYGSLVIYTAKKFVFEQEITISSMLLLFSLIVSLFEYTYPFGPGTTQFMLWFLLGQDIYRENCYCN